MKECDILNPTLTPENTVHLSRFSISTCFTLLQSSWSTARLSISYVLSPALALVSIKNSRLPITSEASPVLLLLD